ncbi:hypothetical protein [Plantactinospora endophytica]|uniref:DUF624 domain-containing protein n=1 Tax=Plantactinospora endophytica TaxID=673535 RepID=A0ABQ4DS67_9ACTN|nr:hypothetical protein [Plantactinospora endophytica]GIG85303.1 hypothetical protein Pen02_02390 [Plantactinospora endophytica]
MAEVPRRGAESGPGWPEEPVVAAPRPDWRETLRTASDLALLGIVVALVSLPVVTVGAAVATASAALHTWIETGSWPGLRPVLRDFRRAVIPGILPTVLAGIAAAVLAVNLLALTRGVVPGGVPLIVVTAALTAAAGGFAGLTVVRLGQQGGPGWRDAVRGAAGCVRVRPATLLGTAGTVALATLLCVLILPPLTPILVGYTLFGLHATTRRLAGPTPS